MVPPRKVHRTAPKILKYLETCGAELYELYKTYHPDEFEGVAKFLIKQLKDVSTSANVQLYTMYIKKEIAYFEAESDAITSKKIKTYRCDTVCYNDTRYCVKGSRDVCPFTLFNQDKPVLCHRRKFHKTSDKDVSSYFYNSSNNTYIIDATVHWGYKPLRPYKSFQTPYFGIKSEKDPFVKLNLKYHNLILLDFNFQGAYICRTEKPIDGDYYYTMVSNMYVMDYMLNISLLNFSNTLNEKLDSEFIKKYLGKNNWICFSSGASDRRYYTGDINVYDVSYDIVNTYDTDDRHDVD